MRDLWRSLRIVLAMILLCIGQGFLWLSEHVAP